MILIGDIAQIISTKADGKKFPFLVMAYEALMRQ
jgi:hypothetical protein